MNIPLQQIIKVHYGKALKSGERDETGQFLVYGSNGVVGKHKESFINQPTLIIGRKGSVGAVTYAASGGWAIDTTFYVEIIDKNEVDLRYLFYALKTANLSQHTITTSIPGLNRDNIYQTKIPLPPLDEQKRIAAVLDKADEVRAKRRAAITKLDSFLQSVFLDMFEGKDFEIISIAEMLSRNLLKLHKDGNHGSLYPRSEDFASEGVPFLSAKAVMSNGFINYSLIEKLKESKANQLRIGWIEKGDVLLAHNATVGKVGLYQADYERALLGTSLTAFRPNHNEINSFYLWSALRSDFFQKQLFSNIGQTTRNQVPITAQRELKIVLPPYDLQIQYAEKLTSTFKLKEKLSLSSTKTQTLFQSLQQRAFAGELFGAELSKTVENVN